MSYSIGAVRPGVALTLAVLAVMAIASSLRSLVASALGLDTAPEDKVAVMSMRAAANQFGYLVGAAAGGLDVRSCRIQGLDIALGAMFLAAAVIYAPRLLRITARAAPQAAG
jgi:predicted MFS family arabinose efflux permease